MAVVRVMRWEPAPRAPETYTEGFYYQLEGHLTTRRLDRLCACLSRELGAVIVPEAITEGGLLYESWPGKESGQYKTIRLSSSMRVDRWPWIVENQLAIWAGQPDRIIFRDVNTLIPSAMEATAQQVLGGQHNHPLFMPKRVWQKTFLKAFGGAPCFTMAELETIMAVFRANGFPCRFNGSQNRLSS